jgi:pseudaminic acid synthase
MNPVAIGGRLIGPGRPCFIAAEMSANHDRNLAHALRLMDIAAAAGVDAVKLQTYTAESLTVPSDHPSARIDPIWGAPNLFDLYSRAAMPLEFHEPLLARARELDLMVLTSVYDPRDVDFCEKLGFPAYKVASFELVHLPLLRVLAQTAKPVILSTGMASLGEVEEALDTLHGAGCGHIVLLQCCSTYPAAAASVNLAALETLRTAFGCPVGFSDHTIGSHVACAAVALGACFLEKHYTSDPGRPGPDHRFSIGPEDLRAMVAMIRDVEASIGSGRKKTAIDEEVNKKAGRRSLIAVRAIPEGERIEADAIRILRPGSGLHPRYLDVVLGRTARRSIAAGQPVTWDDV